MSLVCETRKATVETNICISSHSKEELSWVADKWLQVISTMLQNN